MFHISYKPLFYRQTLYLGYITNIITPPKLVVDRWKLQV